MKQIECGSVTHAMKAKKVLSRKGIVAKISKDVNSECGCSFIIEVPDEKYFDSLIILKNNGIKFDK